MPDIGLFIDFGSTYTKIVAFDLENEKLIGREQSESTVDTDIVTGLESALDKLKENSPEFEEGNVNLKLACSSAAGGLCLVVIGLVPSLTMKAARLAALGAGAKVVGTYSHKLNHPEVTEIEKLLPDIILLAGGTDGGNEEVVLHNARMLADSSINAPIVYAGNKVCSDQIQDILTNSGKSVTIVENVLSELDSLNVEPSRGAIRRIFMERIIYAKGLRGATERVDKVLMPTPMAVLKAAELLSIGTPEEHGLGDLLVVDIGGATTDIHSIGSGHPKDQGIIEKGLPEPYAKRTVEGDLGIRYNATAILETAGIEKILENSPELIGEEDLQQRISHLSRHVDTRPLDDSDFNLDLGLARTAAEIAVSRHAGQLEEVYAPSGRIYILRGKDLTGIRKVIGTGGIFAYGRRPLDILKGTLFKDNEPFRLKPKDPDFSIDNHYILFAIGLLADNNPDKALRIGKRYLKPILDEDNL